MRFLWRRVPADTFDHELAWLGISVGTVACGAVWMALGLPWPRCLFRALTGLPCVSCGATRAAISFFQGNLSTAWHWNPLAFAAFCALIVFNLYAVIVIVGRTARLRIVEWTARERNVARMLIISLVALNWIYLLAHADRF
jgi:hypothetical protein